MIHMYIDKNNLKVNHVISPPWKLILHQVSDRIIFSDDLLSSLLAFE
jgi:hypothetical protein